VAAIVFHSLSYGIAFFYPNHKIDPAHMTIVGQMAKFHNAIVAFAVAATVVALFALLTPAKPRSELAGLVLGMPDPNSPDPPQPRSGWPSPATLGALVLVIVAVLIVLLILAKNWTG